MNPNAEEQRRIHNQLSAAEVPGFHARTSIDDTIGKLYALRQRLGTPVPNGLEALLDDIDALTERAVALALDPDAPEIHDGEHLIIADNQNPRWSRHYSVSASSALYFCSCGAPNITT